MIQICRYLALLALFSLSSTAPAQPVNAAGAERILSYSSDIRIGRDAALDVTETIRVNTLGNEFRHGIYRDFPSSGREGGPLVVGFEVSSVTRDGRPEPWRMEPAEGSYRIMIGDADVMLRPGAHTYRIRYRTTGQLFFLTDRDELYWNVTGNGWDYAIDHAEARIRLPARVRFGARAFYTGQRGSTQSDARVIAEQPGEIRIAATRGLEPGEGLTIAVAWRKGIVRDPGR